MVETIKDNLYDIFAQCKSDYFIETGSHEGYGIARAIDIGFKYIHSIEIQEKYWRYCMEQFANNSNVFLHFGDSLHWLPELIKNLKDPATFWIDAHMSGISRNCPTIEELKIIGKSEIKDHIILIDDMADFGTPAHEGITIEDLKREVLNINPDYHISFASTSKPNNVMICRV